MKGKNKWKRFLSWLLVFAMMLGLMPATVFADTAPNTTAAFFTESGDWQQVTLTQPGDQAIFTFTAPEDGTYIMDCQVNEGSQNFGIATVASASNPILKKEYRNPPSKLTGYVLEMKKGDAYTLALTGNSSTASTVTVGVGTPADSFNGFFSYYYDPVAEDGYTHIDGANNEAISAYFDDGKLVLAFFVNNSYFYDESIMWEASSSNAAVISYNHDNVAIGGEALRDYTRYVGYAPIFELMSAGEATITISATYQGNTVKEEFDVKVYSGSNAGTPDTPGTPSNPGPGGSSKEEFTSMSDLEALLAKYSQSTSKVSLRYRGTDYFKVEKNLTVPANIELSFSESYPLKIAENALVTVEGDIFCGELAVNGALTIKSNGQVNPSGLTKVNGSMTVETNGDLLCAFPIRIEGTLVNNGKIYIQKQAFQSADIANGVISTVNTGTFTCGKNAELQIETDPSITDIQPIVLINNLSEYDVINEPLEETIKLWTLKHAGDIEQHAIPTNLQWGVEYSRNDTSGGPGSNNANNATPVVKNKPGAMSWTTEISGPSSVLVKLYNAENDNELESWITNFNSRDQLQYHTDDWFMINDDKIQTGKYYFTVQLLGDGKNYRNSDVAKSDVYDYVKPSAQLDPCEDAVWVGRYEGYVNWMKWSEDSDSTYRDGYQVQLWYSETEQGPYAAYNSAWDRRTLKTERPFSNRYLEKGTGYYKFRVRTLSNNIETYQNGEWSQLSRPLDLRTLPADVSENLKNILDSTDAMSNDEIRNAVQNVKAMELLATLVTDPDNTGATVTLKNLEAEVGGPANIQVTPGARPFNKNEISIVGANLNLKDDADASVATSPITLVLDAAKDDHDLPDSCDNNAVFVQFSMTVTDIVNPGELKVPVKITLPVPDTIDPKHLVIVHYHQDGESEVVWPYVYEKNGKSYADFVLTSFSDFTLAQEIQQDDGSVDDGDMDSGIPFASVRELQDLINSDEVQGKIFYVGEGPLSIQETLVIPQRLRMFAEGKDIVVEKNGNLTVENALDCANLQVLGAMTANGRVRVNNSVSVGGTMTVNDGMFAGSSLSVTGTLSVPKFEIQMDHPAKIIGAGNVKFAQDWQSIEVEKAYHDVEGLVSGIQSMSSNVIKHERVNYRLYASWEDNMAKKDLVISQDITIPDHLEVDFNNVNSITIAKGTTVTNNGELMVWAPLTIKGVLKNEGMFNVQNMRETENNSEFIGKVTLADGGAYSGTGDFQIHVDLSVSGLNDILFGFKMDDIDINSNIDEDGNTHYWLNTNVAGKTKLATPFNLHWGTEYREIWEWNDQTQMGVITGFHKLVRPGCMSWETDRPDQARAEIKVYRVGETTPCLNASWGFDPQVQPQYRSIDDFMRYELPSGSYYFTVQSMADSIEYRNSDIADSRYDLNGNFNPDGIYHYVSASEKLKPVTNLQWDDRDDDFVRWSTWKENSGSSYIDGYWVDYYYSPTLNGEYVQYGADFGRGNTELEMPFGDHFLQEKGVGYYKFKVKVLSSDIETIGNSEWSDFSPALNVQDISVKVNSDLNNLLNDVYSGNKQPDDIRTEVQKMDTQDLQAALLADTTNSMTTQNLAQLEQMAGGPAQIQVTQDASAFHVNDISIVGANLNNKAEEADEDNPITLIVDKPQKQHVIPERYNSAVAVRFSMTLENVEDPKYLDVPVKITLPVPSSINPDFLVIMHYDVYGGHELIWPHVYEINGKYYADFVLTSFSDFIMTETVPMQDHDDDEPAFTKKPAAAENPLPDYVVSGQWTLTDGKWTFADNNGEVYKNKWAAVVNPYANKELGQSEFDWFFFDANGHMMTGWVLDGGRWYYLNPNSDGTQGSMLTGWQLIDGKWYYLNPISDGTKGAMIADAWIDNYYVDANGVWDETK